MNVPVIKLIQELIKSGILASVNEELDFETASIVAEDFGFKIEKEKKEEPLPIETERTAIKVNTEKLKPRPPVVVVMGHVDHGKSKLLEAIRNVEMLKLEAGGITQHIGAYQVVKNGRKITFLDTPGHEAFVAMRSRGARVADIAILVVAADDGVQPQTIEAVNIIQAAKLPFVVAINKIDKGDADQERIKRQLADLKLIPEEWGGKTVCVPVSAKTGQGIEDLLQTLILIADLEKDKLMAEPSGPAHGTVIESHRDPGEGSVATILIQGGALHPNDTLAAGDIFYGRVKAMKSFQNKPVTEALPSEPVKIMGFKILPQIGTLIEVKQGDLLIRQKEKERPKTFVKKEETESTKPGLRLFIKADALGSLEAISHELEKLKTKEVEVTVVDQAFGNVRESDVAKAKAREAQIFGFNVEIEPDAVKAAVDSDVKITVSPVIYDLMDKVKLEIEALLPALIKEVPIGTFSIMKLFHTEGNEQIVGGRVLVGELAGGSSFNLTRKAKKMGRGEAKEIRKGSERVRTVGAGQEVGIKIKISFPLKEGDILEFFKEEKEAQKLVINR
jgi:translation initiation factor IF-2